jgi:hypothetical protein
MFSRTAVPVTVQGPRKGEPSSRSMRNGLWSQPARLVRGSSRRIMSMRFRPANIRVINRRASFWAVIGPAVQTECSELTSRNVFPLRRPSRFPVMPQRCSPARVRFAAPNNSAPLPAARRCGRDISATGGSGGNTSLELGQKKERPALLLRRKADLIFKTYLSAVRKGIDRSLHIRTAAAG